MQIGQLKIAKSCVSNSTHVMCLLCSDLPWKTYNVNERRRMFASYSKSSHPNRLCAGLGLRESSQDEGAHPCGCASSANLLASSATVQCYTGK